MHLVVKEREIGKGALTVAGRGGKEVLLLLIEELIPSIKGKNT